MRHTPGRVVPHPHLVHVGVRRFAGCQAAQLARLGAGGVRRDVAQVREEGGVVPVRDGDLQVAVRAGLPPVPDVQRPPAGDVPAHRRAGQPGRDLGRMPGLPGIEVQGERPLQNPAVRLLPAERAKIRGGPQRDVAEVNRMRPDPGEQIAERRPRRLHDHPRRPVSRPVRRELDQRDGTPVVVLEPHRQPVHRANAIGLPADLGFISFHLGQIAEISPRSAGERPRAGDPKVAGPVTPQVTYACGSPRRPAGRP